MSSQLRLSLRPVTHAHLLIELPELMDLARRRDIDLSSAITRRVPLASGINEVLDDLDRGTSHLRAVVTG